MKYTTFLAALLAGAFAASANAAPLTINGLGMEKNWVDTEAAADEMPDFVWGNADTNNANEIGLYVAFNDGNTGSITWTGVSPVWNSNNTALYSGVTVTSATGFFAAYATSSIHYLYNTAATNSFPQALPIAWAGNPNTPYGNNVELDYNEQNGSEFRSSVTGWVSAEWATYSSTAPTGTVPLPATLPVLAGAIGVFALLRRKSA